MELFVEKYRPQSLDEFVGNESLQNTIGKYLEEGNIQNLLFFGSAGCGKTSLAKLIAKQLRADVLYLNSSDERGIDAIREKIVPFASSMGLGGTKIVILDEADYLTPQAQASLRNTIETFHQNCRFILTCNYINRIIDPLQSRCKMFNIVPPSKVEVFQHLKGILDGEGVEFCTNDLAKVVKQYYPDLRKMLNTIQGSIHKGELNIEGDSENSDRIKELINSLLNGGKPNQLRTTLVNLGSKEFDSMFRALYDRIEEFKNPAEAILIISKYQYEYGFVLDKEICIMAMLLQLKETTKKQLI
jgi:DNA polymerase III delta prime subunit